MNTAVAVASGEVRRVIRVRGQIQGVGFRPFVYRLATELDLAGFVRNDGAGVEIDVQGDMARVDALVARIASEAPALARIDAVEDALGAPEAYRLGFTIAATGGGAVATTIPPDTAVCAACLAELFDPDDRRHRYAFINCTHCGPRFTITRSLPYDRPSTSMRDFVLCRDCRAEYESPANRRFHAQPNACPACGPKLELRDASGRPVATDDAIRETVRRLRAGAIVAIKGLGGFHLACNARNGAAVARLRARKHRDEKPFAVMAAGAASLAGLAQLTAASRALLERSERPIVLLPKDGGCDAALAGVAPGLPALGVMLPYTPLQYLLFHEAANRPQGLAWLNLPQALVFVMTSANDAGEPIVAGNDEALARLAGIADAFVLHDRDIVQRCDDSVVMPASALAPRGACMRLVRRARGFVPGAIKLRAGAAAVLATGAHLKSTACLTRGAEAFLSAHIGDLDNAASCAALEAQVEHLEQLLEIAPQAIACDLHPDFFSTRLAERYAAKRGLPLVRVQHHHAHIAAVAAEHALEGPLLGLALDGVGMGDDGAAWGGELLFVDGARCTRLGHLSELALPGGDRAAREPWRMAVAALDALGCGEEAARRFPQRPAAALRAMIARGVNCPRTSSAGRWFDAAAGLLGVREVATYEGQAAMLLEGLAARHGREPAIEGGFHIGAGNTLDLAPLAHSLVVERSATRGAARFHATLAFALAHWVQATAAAIDVDRVVLGGGCFMNRILSETLRGRLEAAGLAVFEAQAAPPNDGGVSLGQAWVARHALENRPCA